MPPLPPDPDPSHFTFFSPPHPFFSLSTMSNLDELKSLVSQLQAKIDRLEGAAKSGAAAPAAAAPAGKKEEAKTPAQHLRMVLMGPPGAGKLIVCW